MSGAAEWQLTRTYDSVGGRVAYEVLGHGVPVVLVHGAPSWSYLWRNVANELAGRFRVYVYDLLGYGTSEKREGQDVSIGAQTRLLAELLDFWQLEQPYIAGHDFGAALTLRLILLKGTRFRRVALCDAVAITPWITPFSRHVQRYLEAFQTLPEHIHRQMIAAHLRKENPRLVYCSIPAFAEGPRREEPGYDLTLQALSGLMSITGPKGGEPTKVGVAILDVATGLFAAIGILAALRDRDRTGGGTCLEVPLFHASVAALVNQAANYLMGGEVPRAMGNEHPNIVPYQAFQASDRMFVVAAGNDGLFQRMCDGIGRPELGEDPRFATNENRVRNREELIPILTEVFGRRPAGEWLGALEARGVPCAPVRTLDEVFASPEAASCIEEIADRRRGLLRLVRSPLLYVGGPLPTRLAPPHLDDPDPMVWKTALEETSQ